MESKFTKSFQLFPLILVIAFVQIIYWLTSYSVGAIKISSLRTDRPNEQAAKVLLESKQPKEPEISPRGLDLNKKENLALWQSIHTLSVKISSIESKIAGIKFEQENLINEPGEEDLNRWLEGGPYSLSKLSNLLKAALNEKKKLSSELSQLMESLEARMMPLPEK